jgi:hypothetical protein
VQAYLDRQGTGCDQRHTGKEQVQEPCNLRLNTTPELVLRHLLECGFRHGLVVGKGVDNRVKVKKVRGYGLHGEYSTALYYRNLFCIPADRAANRGAESRFVPCWSGACRSDSDAISHRGHTSNSRRVLHAILGSHRDPQYLKVVRTVSPVHGNTVE